MQFPRPPHSSLRVAQVPALPEQKRRPGMFFLKGASTNVTSSPVVRSGRGAARLLVRSFLSALDSTAVRPFIPAFYTHRSGPDLTLLTSPSEGDELRMAPLSQVLADEFRRVAREEKIEMQDLVDQVATLTGYSARQLYNYRSGKWPIPADLIPTLCKRFKSAALLRAMSDAVEAAVELPADRDLFDMSMEVLKEASDLLFAVASSSRAGFDQQVLNELDEATERLVRRERMLLALLSRQYETSQERKRA